MEIEKIQTEIVEMIENPSWQDNNGNIPIISNEEFKLFLQKQLNNSNLSDKACNQIKKQLVNCGFLLDFNKLIVMKPQWLADTFKSIISTKNEIDNNNNEDGGDGKKGIISLNQIETH